MQHSLLETILASYSQAMEDRIHERLRERIENIDKESPKNQEEYLTIDELCELTRLKKATIYAMRSRREIPAYKFGRELRFRRSEIEDWMQTRRQVCLTDYEEGGDR